MAIHDLDTELSAVSEVEADVCVVGSGAAGLSLVGSLASSGLTVVVIEGGGRHREASSDAQYQIAMSGRLLHGATEGRFRVYGGSTVAWGGQALPLFDHVFAERPWLGTSWPMAPAELEPFYGPAADFLGIGEPGFELDVWSPLGFDPPPLDPSTFPLLVSRWSRNPRLGDMAWGMLQSTPHVSLFLHANLVAVDVDRNRSAVRTLTARSLSGRELRVRARAFVLACGGIETPRLLLSCETNDGRPWLTGLPATGRFYQDHLVLDLAEVRSSNPSRFDDYFENFFVDGVKYMPRLPLAFSHQRDEGTTDIGGFVVYRSAGVPSLDVAKIIARRIRQRDSSAPLPTFKELARATLAAPELAQAHTRLLRRKRIANPREARRLIGVHVEQVPSPASRIEVTDRRDAIGLRRAVLHWEISPVAHRSTQVFFEALASEFRDAAIAELIALPGIHGTFAEFGARIRDLNHHMGATRMGTDPASSVVDLDLRVHGFENLYVASTSVYPCAGHSNPTFTLIALSLRLAKHLKDVLLPPASSLTTAP